VLNSLSIDQSAGTPVSVAGQLADVASNVGDEFRIVAWSLAAAPVNPR
jgi:hypothetical protein